MSVQGRKMHGFAKMRHNYRQVFRYVCCVSEDRKTKAKGDVKLAMPIFIKAGNKTTVNL